jgi:hypothetical protein
MTATAWILSLSVYSCTQQLVNLDLPSDGATVLFKNLNADSEDHFTFFSLRDSAVVERKDSATDKWDIAFRKTAIIVNGGKIRVGKGSIQRLTNQSYDALKEAPAEGYKTDDADDNLALTAKSGESWYSYDATVINTLKDVVLVVKTGDGKQFAKFQILSYYKDAVVPNVFAQTRYYTFKYYLQRNGTRSFE